MTTTSRRPLKSRGTAWATSLANALLARGITPNQVSLASIAAALLGGAAFYLSGVIGWQFPSGLLLLLAAAAIQLRLLCNLLDGMLAVEGRLGSPEGDLYNEMPDRLSDVVLLLGAGLAVSSPLVFGVPGVTLGWIAALLAVGTAYVRALCASAGAPQLFMGPMAKPHRMAVLTLAAILAAVERFGAYTPRALELALVMIILGCIVTIVRRTRAGAAWLREHRPSP